MSGSSLHENAPGNGLRQTEASREWSEQKFRTLIEHSSDIYSLIDARGNILYKSPCMSRILGFSPEEVVGHNAFEFAHPDDRPALLVLFQQLLAEPDQTLTGEFRHLHKDGSYRWVEGVASNMLAEPAVGAIVFTFRDISQRKRMESLLELKLRQLESAKEDLNEQNRALMTSQADLDFERRRYRELFDCAPDGYVVTDLNGLIQETNQAACGMLRQTSNFLRHLPLVQFFVNEDRRSLRDVISSFHRGSAERSEAIEARLRRGQAEPMPCSLVINAIRGVEPAVVVGLRWLLRDITAFKRTEQALREGEGHLRVLTQTMPAVPWSATTEGKVDYFSDKWLVWTGLRREQAMGYGWKQVMHPEELPDIEKAVNHSLQTGEPLDMEHRLRRADGSFRWYRSRALPQREESGRVVRWYGITDDIHELKTAHKAACLGAAKLREREQRLRLALDTAALGSYERDLTTNLVQMNAHCRAILGVPDGPPDPETAYKALHPEDRERVLATAARAFDPSRREICAAEFRIVRPDGSVRWVAGRGRVVFDDSVNPPRGLKFLGVLHDITDRKAAEETLQNQNRRLSLLREATASLLLVEEPDQIIALVAQHLPECLQIEGIVQFDAGGGDELRLRSGWGIGREMLARWPDRLRFEEDFCGRVAQERQPIIAVRVQQSTDPGLRRMKELGVDACACYPLIVGERLLGTFCFLTRRRDSFESRDHQFFETLAGSVALAQERARLSREVRQYTENLEHAVENRTVELREMIAEMEHMSYSIVHDMRAPLRSMIGFSEILQAECSRSLSHRGRDFLQRIVSSAARMDGLITDALSYNRAVRTKLPLEPVDPGSLLRGMLESYPEFQPPQAEIRMESDFPWVLANQSGLTQCFSNILGNAVKFVEPGTRPRVRLWAQRRGDFVRLWFEDNGTGVPKDSQQIIFDMFQRLAGSEFEGTGIGLALVRKVAERMGGRVGVESEEGKGSRFWIELRMADPGAPGGLEPSPAALPQA